MAKHQHRRPRQVEFDHRGRYRKALQPRRALGNDDWIAIAHLLVLIRSFDHVARHDVGMVLQSFANIEILAGAAQNHVSPRASWSAPHNPRIRVRRVPMRSQSLDPPTGSPSPPHLVPADDVLRIGWNYCMIS